MIISVSRRTDIPSFYSEWFFNRLKEGYVLVPNPYNPTQLSKINLSPKDVECFVFWTKDVKPMLNRLDELVGYNYYIQHTITSYQQDLEPNIRKKADILDTFIEFSKKIGKERMIWRYDPILLSDKYTEEYHYEYFEKFCKKLKGYTNKCIISFVDLDYKHVARNVKGLNIYSPNTEVSLRIAKNLNSIASKYNIVLESCAEHLDLSSVGIKKSACIDKNLIESIIGYKIKVNKDKGQRSSCNCVESRDIGIGSSCIHSCAYCYSFLNKEYVFNNFKQHDKNSPLLIGNLQGGETIIKPKKKNIRESNNNQLNLLDLMNSLK